jgi:hypothetical protein
MATIRDIITHVEVETALHRRICHRNRKQHSVQMGQKCLAVHDHDGGRKNYCLPCALEILAKAKTKLLTLEQEIQN